MARIEAAHSGGCPLCALVGEESALIIGRSRHAVAALSRYPVRWGQVVVTLTEHTVRYAEVSDEQWQDLSALALRVAQALEETLKPARCYVASIGTSEEGLSMTTPHLHFNVIPVDGPGERPKDVLTWSHGILVGNDAEWLEMRSRLTEKLSMPMLVHSGSLAHGMTPPPRPT